MKIIESNNRTQSLICLLKKFLKLKIKIQSIKKDLCFLCLELLGLNKLLLQKK